MTTAVLQGSNGCGESKVEGEYAPYAIWSNDELNEYLDCRAALYSLCLCVFDSNKHQGLVTAVLDASDRDICTRPERLLESKAPAIHHPEHGPDSRNCRAVGVVETYPAGLDALLSQASRLLAAGKYAGLLRVRWHDGMRAKYATLGTGPACRTEDEESLAAFLSFADSAAFEALSAYRCGDKERALRIVALQVGLECDRMGHLALRLTQRLKVTQPADSPYIPLSALASAFFQCDAELGESALSAHLPNMFPGTFLAAARNQFHS